jgi:hypothetical protein
MSEFAISYLLMNELMVIEVYKHDVDVKYKGDEGYTSIAIE